MDAAMALSPRTPVEAVYPFADQLSMVLVMTGEWWSWDDGAGTMLCSRFLCRHPCRSLPCSASPPALLLLLVQWSLASAGSRSCPI